MTTKEKLSAREIDNLVEILKAAAHPIRMAILLELLHSPCCVSDIHQRLNISQPVASQHLTILRNSGMVTFERDGASRCYALKNPRIVEKIVEILNAGIG